MPDLQALFGDPESLLGAIQSPQQRALLPQLEAIVAVIVGYVDHVMDTIGDGAAAELLACSPRRLRRRRVEAAPSDRFVERLFGLELTQAQYDRGGQFIEGVVERAGDAALDRLWEIRAQPAHAGRGRRTRAVARPHRPARRLSGPARSSVGSVVSGSEGGGSASRQGGSG